MLLHNHNRPTYENIIKLFKTQNRIAAVQPTGTGKSYLIMQLISDNVSARFAVCSPSVYIFSQLQTIADENNISLQNADFLTYSRLAQMTEQEIKAHEYDYIILDEFHRCGAAEWGRGVEEL
ncbi:MAG: type III restriction endonuclease subunit R, partial [Ruminococcus sp.]|nr:type III restriction endonuclease subunit R [Ruminococcus sp.]